MKKLKFLLIIIVVLLIGVGGGYYIIYKPLGNPSTPIDNSTNNNDNKGDDNSSNDESKEQPIVSKESIEKLAEFKLLNIDTSFPTIIEGIDFYAPSVFININLIDGKLYLTTDKQHKSLISNFNEKVIFMTVVGSSTDADMSNVIVLTEKGNLYLLNNDRVEGRIGPFDDNVYTNLQLNEPVTIPFKKLNPDNIKVLGISRYEDENGGKFHFYPVVYTNQGFKTLNMDNYKIIKSILGGPYENILIIYKDNTIKSKVSNEVLKNIDNSNLIAKEIYTSIQQYTYDLHYDFYIIDNSNHLYIEDNNGNLSLYKDSPVKSTKSVNLNVYDYNKKQLTIIFQDNTTLKIKYSIFYNALEDILEY